ncbi:MAG TPA: hypothetical protein DHW61_12175 [Lachnoclostridium phytofermentans]|uniref:Uncharacterized protein n=1 Tax=Lachnoclostridium phytofermentans TaxID=66219 RepID=A0A3D2X7P8_9FIRM|nr:hypothetical protein [Lachnoclostridium sp.]HCL03142.1 hypothetical protein [Lachnoclostridium phytofermentans]
MINQGDELREIITKFAESGWDLIDAPSIKWLNSNLNEKVSEIVTNELITAVEKADSECGNCGCEFDPLYKRALVLLRGI